jgi:hypothetical protein
VDVAEVERPGLERDLVAAPPQVAEGEAVVGLQRGEQRLEVREELHPLREGVADEDDPVSALDREGRPRGALRPRWYRYQEAGEEDGQQSVDPANRWHRESGADDETRGGAAEQVR